MIINHNGYYSCFGRDIYENGQFLLHSDFENEIVATIVYNVKHFINDKDGRQLVYFGSQLYSFQGKKRNRRPTCVEGRGNRYLLHNYLLQV